jgi:hypothetical protein
MSFEYGLRRAVFEVTGGIVMSVIMDALLSSGSVSPAQAVLFSLMNVATTVIFILAMPFWGTVYLVGWLSGLLILSQAGLVGILDGTLYFGVPLAILILRVWNHLRG